MNSGILIVKKEVKVERKEPTLQIKVARLIEIAEIRSVSTGARYAITEASKPTELNIIRSIIKFGVGKITRAKRWKIRITAVIHIKLVYRALVDIAR